MQSQQPWWKKSTHPMFWIFVLFFCFPKFPFIGKYLSLGTEVMIWALFAVGFNILLGYTGLTSFGHGAYFGIGAYTAGIIFLRVYPGFWLPLLFSIVGGALFAGLVGLIVARKRGIYFSLLTIAFGQVFYFVAFRWEELTGGETGLSKIDRIPIGIPGLFQIKLSTPINYYYVCWAVFLIATIVVWKIVHSPFGKVIQGIRENEVRTRYLGYNVYLYKWASFTISGAFAGLAGGLYTFLINSAFATVLDWTQSGNVVMMNLLGGGLVNFFGPILGATIFISSRDLLSAYISRASYTLHFEIDWLFIYGLMFVFVILFIPTGILGLISGKKRAVLK